MCQPKLEFTAREIAWFVDIHGRRIYFTFLRTIWHVGDEDKFVTAFILN